MNLHVIVLAAGQGKRMRSALPKVLHPVLFRPMLHHVLDLAHALCPQTISVVVGHGQENVRQICEGMGKITFVEQKELKGTGHAVQQVVPLLKNHCGKALVLCGDVPALTLETTLRLLETDGVASVLTARPLSWRGYGRILRDAGGKVRAIREEADCSPEEKKTTEVNSGIYVFDLPSLLGALTGLQDANRQGEFYLTDVIEILVGKGHRVDAVEVADPREVAGINDRIALSEVESFLQHRTNTRWMAEGVTLQDPRSTWIDATSKIAPDVRIETGCQIIASTLQSGVVVEAGCRLLHSEVGANTLIKQGSYLEQSQVAAGCTIGPYAHLRPGSRLGENVKIGNFVEIKKSTLARGVKASHLAYIGDAEIGEGTNLGCGFIACNFDGGSKHKTVIEGHVFVGSDSQAVAPVRIGQGSYIASGSTVTEDVPPDSLVLTRGRQVTKPGYAKKYRRQT